MSRGFGSWSLRRPLGLVAVAAAAVALAATVSAQVAINEWGVPTGDSQPTGITVDGSGNVWFTELAGNRIGQISQNGVIQEFTVPTAGSQPRGLAVDAGGKIWFTEFAGNKIGNMTPGGTFDQDNIPTSDSRPVGLAIDGSGNVWFTESQGNKIGRFNPSGSSFEERTVPTAGSQPWGIALDSSGNVWFTERAAGKIGRMTPGGQFAEYQIPTANSGPTGIAIDGSGNIWFAEYDGGKIGMMTPGGQFTEYSLAAQGEKPTWLALDRAGGVWYAGSGTNSFGRLFNGSPTEYGLPTANSTPYGIAVDAGGNVWITEQSANKIAKANGAAPTTAPTPTPVPSPSPSPTGTPVTTPPPPPTPHDNRYFSATGFRIDNDVFWDYFNKRGGIFTFGYPVSRTFTFLGFTTQFFQREIVQLGPDGAARTMNILDSGLMPYTRINGSTFPAPDPSVIGQAPVPGTVNYDVRVQSFVQNLAPNQVLGMNVNFYQAFVSTVKLQDAYPQGGGDPALLPLLNLEMWGIPTSRPQRDPNNDNFVYLRFQRGIMHYDAANGVTQGLLLADYLKSIMTGAGLPSDLDAQAIGSQFYHQYNPNRVNWVDRPDVMPGTNLTYAFERQ